MMAIKPENLSFFSLPIELQEHILLYLQSPIHQSASVQFWRTPFGTRLPALLILSSVCRHFQTLVFKSPYYKDLEWTFLRAKCDSSRKQSALAEFFLCLSQNRTRMKMCQSLLLESIALSRETLAYVFGRVNPDALTAVSLTVDPASRMDEEFLVQLLGRLKGLEKLKLVAHNTGVGVVISDYAILRLSSALRHLRTFSLSWTGDSVSDAGLAALFSHNPNLRNIELSHSSQRLKSARWGTHPAVIFQPDPFNLTTIARSAPYVVNFKLETKRPLTGDLSTFTKLRTLHLIGGNPQKWRLLNSLSHSTRHTLTTLIIDVAPPATHNITTLFADHANFVSCLATFKSLTHLTIDAKAGAWPAGLLSVISTECSCLTHLSVALDAEDYNRDDYVRLVRALEGLRSLNILVVQGQNMEGDWGEFWVDRREEWRILKKVRKDVEVVFCVT